ncbi:hypothetical protein ACFJGX_09725 [Hydrogenophaga sp. UC242_50]|uniref:hypothetical protein n=1 Tax=Hydrogenophaga sp. UC242_50 TaxID=3350169 RepID=UPI0036D2304E
MTLAAVAQGQRERAQDGGQQHRQGEQRRVVDAADLERLQQREHQHIHADGQQPLDVHRGGLLRRAPQVERDQRGAEVGRTHHHQPVGAAGLRDQHEHLQGEQHGGDEHPGPHEGAPQPDEGTHALFAALHMAALESGVPGRGEL